MRGMRAALAALLCVGAAGPAAAETIVFLRHGEKPAAGLGQLSCQGLNRALALPPVLGRLFGRPAAIFAPDPGAEKPDGAASYSYVRPLATIEPTAIALGMPVHAGIGLDDLPALEAALRRPELRDATVLVAWEHHRIVAAARDLLRAAGGDAAAVPEWEGSDFDGLFVVTLGATGASFRRMREGAGRAGDGLPGVSAGGAAPGPPAGKALPSPDPIHQGPAGPGPGAGALRAGGVWAVDRAEGT